MKTSIILYATSLAIVGYLASCSSQRYVSSETDDIYYSSSDRFAENNNDHTTIQEIKGEDYKSSDSYKGDYFSVGKEQPKDQNPNAQEAYANNEQQGSSYNEASGSNGVTNNFYGNTTYSEGDYYEDSYATNLRRFNQSNLVAGYSYYDPYFVSPYWNYGWSYWNPYPYGGVNLGYSSRYGWNVGYSIGWGGIGYRPWYNQPLWYQYMGNYAYWDYWSYGYPYYGAYGSGYGGYGYYGGYGAYGHYNNGYWNGYADGYYNGNSNKGNSRPIYKGRRPSATNNGFSGTSRVPSTVGNDNSSKYGKMGSSEVHSNDANVKTVAVRDLEPMKSSKNTANTRFDGKGIYQVTELNKVEAKDINSRAEATYNDKTSRNKLEKYNVSGGSISGQNKSNKINAGDNRTSADSPSNHAVNQTSRNQTAYSGSSRVSYENNARNSASYTSPISTTRYSAPENSRTEMNNRGYISRPSSQPTRQNETNSYYNSRDNNTTRTNTNRTNVQPNYGETRQPTRTVRQPVSTESPTITRQRTVPQQSAPVRSYDRPSKSERMNTSPSHSSGSDRSPVSSGGGRTSGGRR